MADANLESNALLAQLEPVLRAVLDVSRLEQVVCDCRESLAQAKEDIWAPQERQRSASV